MEKVLIIEGGSPGQELAPREISLVPAGELELLFQGKRPAAFVFSRDQIKALQECSDQIVCRGVKDSRKGLAFYLLGRGKIPLLDAGEYTRAGKLLGSVHGLLKRAEREKDGNIYLLAVRKSVFDRLWAEAKEKKSAPVPKDTGPGSLSDRPRCLPDEVEIPQALKGEYQGCSQAVSEVRQGIMKAARVPYPVLVLGETGTGKEVVAREIHRYSEKSREKFAVVNCAAISAEMLEAELFGHIKGSFTGATATKEGLWASADGGTFFLDEIGDLHLDHQAKILRALDSGKVRPIGGKREREVDARIIAATNRDLVDLMRAGRFREDLFQRLNSFAIFTSPLRDHPEDIPLLAAEFWKKEVSERPLSAKALSLLREYEWPGNVRELHGFLRRAHTTYPRKAEEGKIGEEEVRFLFSQGGMRRPAKEEPLAENFAVMERARCHRHLKNVMRALYATRSAVAPLLEKKLLQEDHLDAIRAVLQLRLKELQRLCDDPALFPNHPTAETFFSVWNNLGALISFQEKLGRDVLEARTFWSSELEKELNRAISLVSGEREKLASLP